MKNVFSSNERKQLTDSVRLDVVKGFKRVFSMCYQVFSYEALIFLLNSLEQQIFSRCFYHAKHGFRVNLHSVVNDLLPWKRHDIWNLHDCKQIHSHIPVNPDMFVLILFVQYGHSKKSTQIIFLQHFWEVVLVLLVLFSK